MGDTQLSLYVRCLTYIFVSNCILLAQQSKDLGEVSFKRALRVCLYGGDLSRLTYCFVAPREMKTRSQSSFRAGSPPHKKTLRKEHNFSDTGQFYDC